MAEEKGYGLLISAIVSIVAIVGMVVLFSSGGTTGQAVSIRGGGGTPSFGQSDKYRDNIACGFVEASDCDSGIECTDGRNGATYCGSQSSFGRPLSTKSERISRESRPCYYAEDGRLVCPGVEYNSAQFPKGAMYTDHGDEGEASLPAYGRPVSLG